MPDPGLEISKLFFSLTLYPSLTKIPESFVGPLVDDVRAGVSEAANLERADLRVQGELLEVHLTLGRDGQALGERDPTVRGDPDKSRSGVKHWRLHERHLRTC